MTSRQFGKLLPVRKLIQMIRQIAKQEGVKLKAAKKTDLKDIAAFYDLELCFAPLTTDGALVENKIILNSHIINQQRQYFTFYHELMHHLIRTNDDILSTIHECVKSPDSLIEQLCNAGAAEFLIPSEEIESHIRQFGFDVTAIQTLAENFQVSYLATAIQLTVCVSHECYFAVAEPINTGTSMAGSLRISYTANSFSARYPIARDTIIPHTHLIHSVYTQRQRITGKDRIPFRSARDWIVECDATWLNGAVYAFFNASPSLISPHQMRLFD